MIYGILGLMLISFAFLSNMLKFGIGITSTPFFTTGYWLLFDYLDYKLSGNSILHKINKNYKILFIAVFTGIFIGLTFDFYGIFISHLWDWYYSGPFYYQILSYIRGLIFGYGVPILMYYSIFRVTKFFIKKYFIIKTKIHVKRQLQIKLFKNTGLFGVTFLSLPLFLNLFVPNLNPALRGVMFLLSLIGLWFILESIEYRRYEKSFLKEAFKGNLLLMIAVIISAFATGFIWEYLNLLNPAWTYRNYPFPTLSIFGVPVSVLGGWILLFVIYLSFFKIVLKQKKGIW